MPEFIRTVINPSRVNIPKYNDTIINVNCIKRIHPVSQHPDLLQVSMIDGFDVYVFAKDLENVLSSSCRNFIEKLLEDYYQKHNPKK